MGDGMGEGMEDGMGDGVGERWQRGRGVVVALQPKESGAPGSRQRRDPVVPPPVVASPHGPFGSRSRLFHDPVVLWPRGSVTPSMGPRFHIPWFYDPKILQSYGSTIRYFYGPMVPWSYSFMAPWFRVPMVPCPQVPCPHGSVSPQFRFPRFRVPMVPCPHGSVSPQFRVPTVPCPHGSVSPWFRVPVSPHPNGSTSPCFYDPFFPPRFPHGSSPPAAHRRRKKPCWPNCSAATRALRRPWFHAGFRSVPSAAPRTPKRSVRW